MFSKKVFKNKPFILLLCITVAVFANTLWNHYSFDDNFVVQKSSHQGFSGIKEIFTTHYWQEKDNTFGYRPIARTTFFIESQLWGEKPFLSHLINLLLYIITIVWLYLLLNKIFPNNDKIIWWTSLLFAIHPIHTEVVASLKNREELLAFLFGIAAISTAIQYIDTQKWIKLVFSALFTWLSILTKENGMVFLLLTPITLFFYKNFNVRWPILVHFIIVFIGAWILYKLPSWILPTEDKILFYFENPLHEIHSHFAKYLLSAESMGFYIVKLIFPYPLSYYYGYKTINIPDTITLNQIVFVVCLITSIYFLLKKRQKSAILTWGIIWFWVSIVPFSNFFIPINGIVAERLVYTASLGFIIAGVCFITIIKKRYTLVFTFIALLFGIYCIKRNGEWKDTETLLRTDMPKLNESAKANASFATMLMNKVNTQVQIGNKINSNIIDTIIKHYKKAIDIYPNYYAAMNNLGLVYFTYAQNDSLATYWFKKAICINNNYSEALYNLARVKIKHKKNNEALRLLNKAIIIDSNNIYIMNDLANLYFSLNIKDSAYTINNLIKIKDTNSDIPYINEGNYFLLSGDTVHAVAQWEKAISKNPNNPNLLYGLSRYFKQHQNIEKSLYYERLLYRIQRNSKSH
ncbi:MAG: hypothetical protein HPY79_04520 [Bacteroidales bacterium]|nr:hypothetical protein [Bacteroidales bacterium]